MMKRVPVCRSIFLEIRPVNVWWLSFNVVDQVIFKALRFQTSLFLKPFTLKSRLLKNGGLKRSYTFWFTMFKNKIEIPNHQYTE